MAPITFIVSLFADGVRIYETNNNGRWYDFGFMLGIEANGLALRLCLVSLPFRGT